MYRQASAQKNYVQTTVMLRICSLYNQRDNLQYFILSIFFSDEEKKTESADSDRIVPNGKTIPRTPAFVLSPAIQRSKKVQEIQEKYANDKEKQIINVDDIVIKGPNVVEDQPTKEKPKKNLIPSGKNFPRTPAIQHSNKVQEIQEKCANEEEKQIINVDDIVIKGPNLVEDQQPKEKPKENLIPSGKIFPRTPAIQQSNKVQEIQENVANDEEKQIINVDDIVIKGPNLVKDQPPKEKPKENFIPSGKQMPRTPFVGSNDKNEIENHNESVDNTEEKNYSDRITGPNLVEDQPTKEKPKENFIPSGKQMPRTPFVGSNDKNYITDEIENHAESIDNTEEKNAKKNSKSGHKIDFGIEETQTLDHFEKPKPPPNRSTPRASKRIPLVEPEVGKTQQLEKTREIQQPVRKISNKNEIPVEKSNKTRSTRSKSDAVSTKVKVLVESNNFLH